MNGIRLDCKNPADMAFITIINYYYNKGVNGRNWVFPIQTEDFRFGRRTPLEEALDSRPIEGDVESH